MAPQLGLGVFRIDQTGLGDAYAMSNGNNKEIWALRMTTWMKPSFPATVADFHVEPIAPAPPNVNMTAFCAFLTGIGEVPAHFEIREHKITVKTCD